jgi:hypothetical protein
LLTVITGDVPSVRVHFDNEDNPHLTTLAQVGSYGTGLDLDDNELAFDIPWGDERYTLQDDFDLHLADISIHFTMGEISITESQISDLGDYMEVGAFGLGSTDVGSVANPDTPGQTGFIGRFNSDFGPGTSGWTFLTVTRNATRAGQIAIRASVADDPTDLLAVRQSIDWSAENWSPWYQVLTERNFESILNDADYLTEGDADNRYTLQTDFDNHVNDTTIHFTQAQISITESQISDFGDYLETVDTIESITGDGATTPLSLVNDAGTPGNDKYYGTDGSGTKGWFDLPDGGGAESLGQLSDVTLGTPANGHGLFFNDGAWRNRTPAQIRTHLSVLQSGIGGTQIRNNDQLDGRYGGLVSSNIWTGTNTYIRDGGLIHRYRNAPTGTVIDLQTDPVATLPFFDPGFGSDHVLRYRMGGSGDPGNNIRGIAYTQTDGALQLAIDSLGVVVGHVEFMGSRTLNVETLFEFDERVATRDWVTSTSEIPLARLSGGDNNDTLQRISGAWQARTPAQVRSTLAVGGLSTINTWTTTNTFSGAFSSQGSFSRAHSSPASFNMTSTSGTIIELRSEATSRGKFNINVSGVHYVTQNNTNFELRTSAGTGAGTVRVRLEQSGDVRFFNNVNVDGNATFSGSWVNQTSDARKKNIYGDKVIPFERLEHLRAKKYRMHGHKEDSVGWIAQEIEPLMPEAVRKDDDGYLSLGYGQANAVLIGSLIAEVSVLRQRVAQLEAA